MNNYDIFTMKTFNRLRNKAQLFSSLADDHYHTRLMHSLEVNSIAIDIVKKLKEKYPDDLKVISVDEELISSIALLHDIGHTPYGHVGERTLHNICSGKSKVDGLPDFEKLDVNCGFKHNINSGLLYKEYLVLHGKDITEFECKIVEGIIKHSSLYYENQSNYGSVGTENTEENKVSESYLPQKDQQVSNKDIENFYLFIKNLIHVKKIYLIYIKI